jgi:hypothetical protein
MKRNVTQKLLQWKNSKRRKPLILRGARQVGKTYSLLEFGKNFFPNYHYINFEKDERARSLFDKDLDPARILEELKFYLDTSIEEQSDHLNISANKCRSLRYVQQVLSWVFTWLMNHFLSARSRFWTFIP